MLEQQPLRVGMAGLGAMGTGMARNLSTAGLLVGVWNRSAGKARTLAAELEVRHAETLPALASACDCLIVCVATDPDVLAVVEAATPGLQRGTVVVDCSTVARTTALALAERLAPCGCGFIDAPVSGGTEGAALGTLAIMVGGDQANVEHVRPALDAIGSKAVHMGPVGAGQATKAVNQIVAAGINQAVSEGLAFAEAMELPLDAVREVVSRGAAGSWFLSHRGSNMQHGKYPPGFKVSLHLKDLKIAADMAREAGVRLNSIDSCLSDYPRLIEAGHADSDISALHALKRKQFQPD